MKPSKMVSSSLSMYHSCTFRLLLVIVAFVTGISDWAGRFQFSNFLSSVVSSSRGFQPIESNDDDKRYMRRALELASRANGQTNPNPCVGCVIVDSSSRIVGEGWHARAGEAHAEVIALRQAGKAAKGSTAYVSLEPCNHYGRTPPCTKALISHGVSKVVIGMVDPDPRVSGAGLTFLRDNGVDVKVLGGLDGDSCKRLNLPYIHRLLYKRPLALVWMCINDDEEVEPTKANPNPTRNLIGISNRISSREDYQNYIIDRSRDISSAISEKKKRHQLHLSEVASLLPSVAPEVDSIILSADFFLHQQSGDLDRFPSHIKIYIAFSDDPKFPGTLEYERITSHLKSCIVFREWCIVHLTSGNIDTSLERNETRLTKSGHDSIDRQDCGDLEAEKVVLATHMNMHSIRFIRLNYEQESPRQSRFILAKMKAQLVTRIAAGVSNAVLIFAETISEISQLNDMDVLQKLVISSSRNRVFFDPSLQFLEDCKQGQFESFPVLTEESHRLDNIILEGMNKKKECFKSPNSTVYTKIDCYDDSGGGRGKCGNCDHHLVKIMSFWS